MSAPTQKTGGARPLRLAVVGAGLVGRQHLDAIARSDRVQLAAIADNDPATESLARECGADYHASLDSLLRDAKIDGIVLATPNNLHLDQGLDCLAAGYPLLVEKPIAVTSEQADRLVDAARQAGLPLLVGHHRRYNPIIHRAKTLIEAGRLGQLRSAHASCWLAKPADYFDLAPWRKQAGAGPVFVNLIHDVDLMRYLCGEVVSVQAQMVSASRGYENEEVAGVLLRFADDVVATLSVADTVAAPWSWETTAAENPAFPASGQSCYWLGGTHGALSIPDLTLWHQSEPHWQQPMARESFEVEQQHPLKSQLEHFAAVIRGEAQPLVSGEEGAASLRVIEAIHAAAASEATVYLR